MYYKLERFSLARRGYVDLPYPDDACTAVVIYMLEGDAIAAMRLHNERVRRTESLRVVECDMWGRRLERA